MNLDVYRMLVESFSDNSPVSLSTLKRRYDVSIINDAISLGYIIETTSNEYGENRYRITVSGREFRNNFHQ